MAWISVHESIDGSKLRNLYKSIGCSKFEAVGILNFLWFWGLGNAEKDGFIPYADREDIIGCLSGAKAGFKFDMEAVVDALFDTGWLDDTPNGIFIHDWEIWQEQWYKAKERREADTNRKRENRRNKSRDAKSVPQKPDEEPVIEPIQEQIAGVVGCQPPEIPSGDPPAPEAPTEPKYSAHFEAFWEAYPRKEEKAYAYKKYKTRLKDGYSEADLLLAAKNYAVQCKRLKTEKRYIKHPKTFLSDSTPFVDYLPKKEEIVQESSIPEVRNPFAGYGEGEPSGWANA